MECPVSKIEINNTNTSFVVTGNPSGTPVVFTECFTPGCESGALNRFYVEYDVSNELCCKYQGIKIDLNPADTINEISFQITFTLPEGLSFGFNSGNLKIKSGQIIEFVYDLCMPGCNDSCNMQFNICNMWKIERDILSSNKDVFIHFTQLLLPDSLDLNTITVQELENIVRSIAKLEKSADCLACNLAKVLETLNELENNKCEDQCTICVQHS